MKLIPVAGVCPEKQRRQLYLFKSFGLPIYRDPTGAFYALVDCFEPALLVWAHLAVEAERIPCAWVLVNAGDLPTVGCRPN